MSKIFGCFSSSSSSSITKNGISGPSTVTFNPASKSIYHINYDRRTIKTIVTKDATVVDIWVQGIYDLYASNLSVIVGLYVEYNPSRNKSATLNLCIGDKCLILQLFHIDKFPPSLKKFLMNPNFFFVGLDVADCISKIKSDYGLDFGGVYVDIKELVTEKFQKSSLKDLAMILLGLSVRKPKVVSLSNWESRILNIEQVEYGCINSYVSYKIGHMLLKVG